MSPAGFEFPTMDLALQSAEGDGEPLRSLECSCSPPSPRAPHGEMDGEVPPGKHLFGDYCYRPLVIPRKVSEDTKLSALSSIFSVYVEATPRNALF